MILKIGHRTFLLPSDKGVATLVSVLSGAVELSYDSYQGEVIRYQIGEEVEVSFVPVGRKVQFVTEQGERVDIDKPRRGSGGDVIIPKPERMKLQGQRNLSLEDRR